VVKAQAELARLGHVSRARLSRHMPCRFPDDLDLPLHGAAEYRVLQVVCQGAAMAAIVSTRRAVV